MNKKSKETKQKNIGTENLLIWCIDQDPLSLLIALLPASSSGALSDHA